MIAVVQYGAGNLFSVSQALRRLGAEVELAATPEKLEQAERIILPGVGAFGAAMDSLGASGMEGALRHAAGRGIPILGICLGFQLLFDSSEESPGAAGLGLFRGAVRRIRGDVKIPQLGWNGVHPTAPSPLMDGLPDSGHFYFANSYVVEPSEPIAVATSDYGETFVSAAVRGNLAGVQFHPEKSQTNGRRFLQNFMGWEVGPC